MANENLFDLTSNPMVGKIHAHKESVKNQILAIPGVVGVGTGMKRTQGIHDPEVISLRVYVQQKLSSAHVPVSEQIPNTMTLSDGTVIPVDVIEVGTFHFRSFYGRYRPVKYGACIGVDGVVVDGTLGMKVTDNTDGSSVILSTNHVLANLNAAPIGAAILQPGPQHGGTNPADKIGALKRFVTMNMGVGGVNDVDAAIASIDGGINVQTKTMCSYINLSNDRAVGMMWAGSEVMTVINPIDAVLSALNCSYGRTKAAAVGMVIKKCGAGTEYTTATITDIGASINIFYQGHIVTFNNQILTAGGVSDASAGDSGAIWWN